jgi:hypothetical protein
MRYKIHAKVKILSIKNKKKNYLLKKIISNSLKFF